MTRRSCHPNCSRRPRSHGTRRSNWPSSTACATRRLRCWPRRAASSVARSCPPSRGLVRLHSLGDPEGAKWQDLGIQVATDEGPREATKFFINGLEPVVTVDTARGHRVQGTTMHRIKVVDPASGEWVWRRFSDVRPGDLVPLALGSLLGEPQDVALPPLAEAYWTGEHHVQVPRHMTASAGRDCRLLHGRRLAAQPGSALLRGQHRLRCD